MKKSDILRVRIDARMLAALKDVCEASGCNLSHLLRESISRELARRNHNRITSEHPPAASSRSSKDARTCAQTLSSLLVGLYSATRDSAERLQQKQRKIYRLLESLLRELSHASDLSCPGDTLGIDNSSDFEVVDVSPAAGPDVRDRALGEPRVAPNSEQPEAGVGT